MAGCIPCCGYCVHGSFWSLSLLWEGLGTGSEGLGLSLEALSLQVAEPRSEAGFWRLETELKPRSLLPLAPPWTLASSGSMEGCSGLRSLLLPPYLWSLTSGLSG